jgi:hypothetical protein
VWFIGVTFRNRVISTSCPFMLGVEFVRKSCWDRLNSSRCDRVLCVFSLEDSRFTHITKLFFPWPAVLPWILSWFLSVLPGIIRGSSSNHPKGFCIYNLQFINHHDSNIRTYRRQWSVFFGHFRCLDKRKYIHDAAERGDEKCICYNSDFQTFWHDSPFCFHQPPNSSPSSFL